jgi:agmatine deiminase
MIVDKDTDFVYFSDLLLTDDKFNRASPAIFNILDKHHVKYGFLKGTKSIWVRDFMPIQIDKGKLIQFRYEPSYLEDYPEERSDPKEVCKLNNFHPKTSKINLDGGNVVKWYNKAIISERILQENPSLTKEKIIEEIEGLLKVEVILIPDIHKANDLTGHADGYVRFLNDKTILINELEKEFDYWKKGVKGMISKYGFDKYEIPLFEYKEKDYRYSAIGIYINFLEIGKLIILPIFETPVNRDEEALGLFRRIFPERIIEPVQINDIAREGGVMNCISWNIKC